MTDFKATMIAEGVEESDPKTTLEAWAHLIKTGLAYKLQGFFGRTANDLINNGIITKNGKLTEYTDSINIGLKI